MTKKCKDHFGNEYNSIEDMCKVYGVRNCTYYSRPKAGWSLKETLENKREFERRGGAKNRNKKCVDHLGNEYESFHELLDAYHMSNETYYRRKKAGHTLEEILTGKNCNHNYVGPDGVKYRSAQEMCETYHITKAMYYARVKRGYSKMEALTGKSVDNYDIADNNPAKSKTCTDHLGNKYDTIGEMCRAYHIKQSTFNSRLSYGFTLEEALTKNTKDTYNSENPKQCIDHLGNKYDRIVDMLEAYSISKSVYYYKLKKGYTIKEILTKAKHYSHARKCTDHLGNKYNSVVDMCNAYGINAKTFNTRLRNGMTLDEALTEEVGKRSS